mgnify:CR=1 FL=1
MENMKDILEHELGIRGLSFNDLRGNLWQAVFAAMEVYKNQNLNVEVRSLHTKRRLYPGLHFIQSLLMSVYLRRRKFDFLICNTLPAVSRIHTASSMANITLFSFVRDHFSFSENNKKYYVIEYDELQDLEKCNSDKSHIDVLLTLTQNQYSHA